MASVRMLWKRSRAYRVLLVVALVYTLLRFVVQGIYLAIMLFPQWKIMGGLPSWTGAEGPMVPADLQIYLNAAKHFYLRQDLYLKGSLERLEEHYPYAPPFAMVFMPFLLLSPVAVSVVHTLLHVVAYGLLYVRWAAIFRRYELGTAAEKLAWSLPLWLVFSSFWTDLGYLNIYIIMALFGTLFIEAILDEHLGRALLWLSVIAQIKPHWTFAIAVPLLMGRWRFFWRLVGRAAVVYLLVAGTTILVAGPAYGLQQYADYVGFLSRLSRDFPWRGPDKPFLGYNHSIKQIVVYLLGVSPATLRLATLIKAVLLMPLVVVVLRHLWWRYGRGQEGLSARLALDLAFLLYLGAFIWLDMVWELSLGVAIYPYLLGTTSDRRIRYGLSAAFLPYALLDPVRTFSFLIGGMRVILPGPYVATDPAIYFPLIMVSILAFYAWLVVRVGRAIPGEGMGVVGGER